MRAFAGLLVVLLMSGCIYEAALVDKPSEIADRRFAGAWRQRDDKNNRMMIRVFDERHYVIVTVDGNDMDIYRAFTCEVEGLRLANVQTLAPGGKENGKWAFFEYRLDGKGQLAVRMVNDKIITPDLKTPEKLREAMAKHRKNPDLFLKESVYVRARE